MNLATSFHALNEQGTLERSFDYLLTYPIFAQDLFILCISECVGQFFIYLMIERFGFIAFGLSLVGKHLISTLFASYYAISGIQIVFVIGLASLLFSRISKAKSDT
jgi:hypothetical protein